MLGGTFAGLVLLPFACAAALIYDVARLRIRLPTIRVYLFVLQYAINDSLEILLAPVYWLLAGFGTQLSSSSSIHRHERLQRWSIDVLARRADRLLGLRLELDEAGASALGPGPAIVLCRHVNVVDSSLPALLYQSRGFHVRGVLMAELLADPGFDLLYGRLGSVFIVRNGGPDARSAVAEMGRHLDDRTVAVIFPEGRLFRPELRERFVGRMASTDPSRWERLSTLQHVLPPRVGGVQALLASAPHADVVVIAHAGLDGYPSFTELVRRVPLVEPIHVTAWRIPRSAVPDDAAAQAMWLDEQWLRVDSWIDDHLTPS